MFQILVSLWRIVWTKDSFFEKSYLTGESNKGLFIWLHSRLRAYVLSLKTWHKLMSQKFSPHNMIFNCDCFKSISIAYFLLTLQKMSVEITEYYSKDEIMRHKGRWCVQLCSLVCHNGASYVIISHLWTNGRSSAVLRVLSNFNRVCKQAIKEWLALLKSR